MSGEITLSPGPLRVLSMRLVHNFRGVWLAELELDPDVLSSVPASGKVAIAVNAPEGTFTLQGTVDPRGSGQFVEFVHMRVLGGAGAWDQTVSEHDYQADGGLSTGDVYTTTAAEIGETVKVASPRALQQFFRSAGPARRVLDAEPSWYVDAAGVTQIGPRPAATLDSSAMLIRWDPTMQIAELTCDVLVLPGTAISDPRIPAGPVIVRDVEQVFDASGSHVTAFCGSNPVSQLVNDLRSMVVEFSGRKFLASYQYRVVQQNSDGRLQLQPVDGTLGLPETLPVPPWTGHPGASAKLLPGSYVRVAFFAADPSQPIVDSYQPGATPIESTVDASAAVHLGPSAANVDVAGGGHPIAFADLILAELVKIAAGIAAAGGSYTPPTLPTQIGSAKASSG